jgi:hypothetical protein
MRDALGEDGYARLMEIQGEVRPDGVFSYNPYNPNKRAAAIS